MPTANLCTADIGRRVGSGHCPSLAAVAGTVQQTAALQGDGGDGNRGEQEVEEDKPDDDDDDEQAIECRSIYIFCNSEMFSELLLKCFLNYCQNIF